MNREQLEEQIGQVLSHISQRAEESQEAAARQQGMHPTDFRCLAFLASRDYPRSPRDVIAHLGLTSGAGTALLDRLEKAGYVRRLPNPDDRRSILIELDRDGAAEPLAVHGRIHNSYVAVTSEFADAELLVIAKFLERIEAISVDLATSLYPETGPARAAS